MPASRARLYACSASRVAAYRLHVPMSRLTVCDVELGLVHWTRRSEPNKELRAEVLIALLDSLNKGAEIFRAPDLRDQPVARASLALFL